MPEVPESLLEERRRLGLDKADEMWEGVLHMVPTPFTPHQRVNTDLLVVPAPLAKARGLLPWGDSTSLFRPGADDDYRVPDQTYARPELTSERGVEGPASLVVEVRSPRDETDEKLDWYAARGVDEVLVVHPETRAVELSARRGERLERVEPDAGGGVVPRALGVRLETVAGPLLRATWDGGTAEV